MKYSLLIIDDDPAKDSIERLVAPAGFSVSLCKSAADFERETAATSTKHHVALIDYRLGARFAPRYEDGIAITRVLLDRYHEVGVVGYSAFLDAKFDPRWDDTVAKWLVAGARWFCDKTSLMAGLGFEVTLQVLLQCAARGRRVESSKAASKWARSCRLQGSIKHSGHIGPDRTSPLACADSWRDRNWQGTPC